MTYLDYINQGGIIVYILLFINIIGFTLIITKIINIFQMKNNMSTICDNVSKNIKKNEKNEKYITVIIQNEIHKYEFGLNTIKTIANIAPLLGLLGTVIGILLSFETISKVGLDNPALFSSSISLALITTVVGLIVAIPHYIFYNYYIAILEKNELFIYNKILDK